MRWMVETGRVFCVSVANRGQVPPWGAASIGTLAFLSKEPLGTGLTDITPEKHVSGFALVSQDD